MTDTRITFLGTGNAVTTKYYNTCFLIRTEGTPGGAESHLLVDGGGGNTILNRLPQAGMKVTDLHEIFLTHAHIDHMLGVLWLVRYMITRIKKGLYQGDLNIYTHDKAISVLDTICRMTFPAKDYAYIGRQIHFREVRDGETWQTGAFTVTCFDVHSTKEKQFGFRMTLPDGKILSCLGDEPFNEAERQYVRNSDWLLLEAYCLYRDREEFRPYEKHHSTALDAGRTAEELNAGNLVLYHTEDRTFGERKRLYSAEASEEFKGRVLVPDDMESFLLG